MRTKTNDFASPKILSVEPGDGDFVLRVTWKGGKVSRVDLTELIFRLKHLRPLRNAKRFKQVKVGDWGWSIAWNDELELSAETLWEKAQEQERAIMTAGDFRGWLEAHELTQQRAALLLGLSKRTISYYATGAQPITRMFALALRGAELELQKEPQKRLWTVLETVSSAIAAEASGRDESDIYERLSEWLGEVRSPSLSDEFMREIFFLSTGKASVDEQSPWWRSPVAGRLVKAGAKHEVLTWLVRRTQEMSVEEFDRTIRPMTAGHQVERRVKR